MLEYEPASPSPVVVIEQPYDIPGPRWGLNIMTDDNVEDNEVEWAAVAGPSSPIAASRF
ncbi:MAG: hypothetical protein ACRDSZ_09475 [Pseudonocardiaceae bacterium]